MTSDEINLTIQTVAVLAALSAAIIALVISAKDRENSRAIAAEDRRVALEQARLMFDLEALTRLSQNLERGGHTDDAISRDMGAEAASLLNVIGPERLPLTWADKRKSTLAEVAAYVADEGSPAFKRHSHEVLLELTRVSERINQLIERP